MYFTLLNPLSYLPIVWTLSTCLTMGSDKVITWTLILSNLQRVNYIDEPYHQWNILDRSHPRYQTWTYIIYRSVTLYVDHLTTHHELWSILTYAKVKWSLDISEQACPAFKHDYCMPYIYLLYYIDFTYASIVYWNHAVYVVLVHTTNWNQTTD